VIRQLNNFVILPKTDSTVYLPSVYANINFDVSTSFVFAYDHPTLNQSTNVATPTLYYRGSEISSSDPNLV
jgi:hypothetical protein